MAGQAHVKLLTSLISHFGYNENDLSYDISRHETQRKTNILIMDDEITALGESLQGVLEVGVTVQNGSQRREGSSPCRSY